MAPPSTSGDGGGPRGWPDARPLRPQQHAIKPGPRCLFLVGRDDPATDPVVSRLDRPARCRNLPGFWEEQGTLHAAYDFLERYCGVRWLNPTDLGTICPKQRTLVVRPGSSAGRPLSSRDAVGATGDNPGLYDEYVALWTKDTPSSGRSWPMPTRASAA